MADEQLLLENQSSISGLSLLSPYLYASIFTCKKHNNTNIGTFLPVNTRGFVAPPEVLGTHTDLREIVIGLFLQVENLKS